MIRRLIILFKIGRKLAKSEILDILEDLKPKENNNLADPRWEQLKNLKK